MARAMVSMAQHAPASSLRLMVPILRSLARVSYSSKFSTEISCSSSALRTPRALFRSRPTFSTVQPAFERSTAARRIVPKRSMSILQRRSACEGYHQALATSEVRQGTL